MPLTPFVGLSVLIHMAVISGHKLFSWLPKKKLNTGKSKPYVYALSVLIIVAVFSFIFLNAAILVRASISDKHSSISITQDISRDAKNLVSYYNMPLGSIATVYSNPLIDFLAMKGYDYSFDARERYALEFDMGEYHGTLAENQTLLKDFFANSGQLPLVGSQACGLTSVSKGKIVKYPNCLTVINKKCRVVLNYENICAN